MISLFVLWPLYIIGIQYERGGWWKLVCPITFIALVLDIILNYTELALLTLDFPKSKEYTFTKRLRRLKLRLDWRGDMAHSISLKMLDPFDPDGYHY